MNPDRLRTNEAESASADGAAGSLSPSSEAAEPIPSEPEAPFLRELRAELGAARISTADDDRRVYARDLWPRSTLTVAAGLRLPDAPQVVVWPDSTAQVAQVVRLCRKHRVPLVPYGAGSGVGGAAVGPAGSLVLDTKSMRAAHIDRAASTVTCEPGLLGWHLEEQLSRAGLTLGHFPSSIMCSTVGGWVATRGAGQMSSKYGKIEDMVRRLVVVDGQGDILRVENGDGGGPDLVQSFVGSEGVLGILTSMTLSVRPKPAARRLRGFAFPSVEAGCQGIRHMMQHGLRPAVVRLYDEIDTLIAGSGRGHGHSAGASPRLSRVGDALSTLFGKSAGQGASGSFDVEELLRFLRPDAERLRGRVEQWLLRTALGEPGSVQRTVEKALARLGAECLLIVGFEGDERIVQKEDACAREVLSHCGGRDLGPEPGNRWLAHRYNVSFKMSRVFRAGAFSDTIEVATTWDKLMPLYREVRAAVAPHALIMAHFSHAYIEGCSIYFTIMARRHGSLHGSLAEREQALAGDHLLYDTIWHAAMQAALRVGAAISHHHGVGRLKTPFLSRDQREGMHIVSLLKRACDPDNLCNPGNLVDATKPVTAPLSESRASEGGLAVPAAESFLLRASGDQTLAAIEQSLRVQGRTLGSLPPWAYARRLSDALAQPRPSEASLCAGRLRDRVAQIAARLPQGATWVVPPQPAPRRATGPDVGTLLLGWGSGQAPSIHAALLRARPLSTGSWLGFAFADATHAAQALCLARALHGATAFEEIVLVSRELLGRVSGAEAALGGAAFALLLQTATPAHVATEIAAACASSLSRLPVTASLPADLCRAFWSEQARSVVWPSNASPQEVAVVDAPDALSLALSATRGPRMLCGVYLHGAAFVGESAPPDRVVLRSGALPVAAPALPALGLDTPTHDAHVRLWPRLMDALTPSFTRGQP